MSVGYILQSGENRYYAFSEQHGFSQKEYPKLLGLVCKYNKEEGKEEEIYFLPDNTIAEEYREQTKLLGFEHNLSVRKIKLEKQE